MGFTGIWQWVIVLVIVLVLFGGRGKISGLMGDFGKGLRSFKKGMKEDETVEGTSEGDGAKTIQSDAASSEASKEKNQTTQS